MQKYSLQLQFTDIKNHNNAKNAIEICLCIIKITLPRVIKLHI